MEFGYSQNGFNIQVPQRIAGVSTVHVTLALVIIHVSKQPDSFACHVSELRSVQGLQEPYFQLPVTQEKPPTVAFVWPWCLRVLTVEHGCHQPCCHALRINQNTYLVREPHPQFIGLIFSSVAFERNEKGRKLYCDISESIYNSKLKLNGAIK